MPTIPQPGERQAEAIPQVRRLALAAQVQARAAQDAIQELMRHLVVIRAADDAPELTRLANRAEEINQRFNSMELGSYMIAAGSAMDAAWQRLP